MDGLLDERLRFAEVAVRRDEVAVVRPRGVRIAVPPRRSRRTALSVGHAVACQSAHRCAGLIEVGKEGVATVVAWAGAAKAIVEAAMQVAIVLRSPRRRWPRRSVLWAAVMMGILSVGEVFACASNTILACVNKQLL